MQIIIIFLPAENKEKEEKSKNNKVGQMPDKCKVCEKDCINWTNFI